MTAMTNLAGTTWLGRWLDRSRHRRLRVVSLALAGSGAIAYAFAALGEQTFFRPADSVYVAGAGLFVAALALERITELLIAPWVGAGDRRIDRQVLIGSLSILVGVTLAGLLGLRISSVLPGVMPGSAKDHDVALDLFVAGFAISAGTKPLHDLISRNEKATKRRKDARKGEAPDEPPRGDEIVLRVGPESGSAEPDRSAMRRNDGIAQARRWVEGGGVRGRVAEWLLAKRVARNDRLSAEAKLRARIAAALPGWRTSTVGDDTLVRGRSTAAGATPRYAGDVFDGLHALRAAGIVAEPVRNMPVDGEPARSVAGGDRTPLVSMGLTPSLQQGAQGGEGIKVAVIDTGVNDHPHGASDVAYGAGQNVLGDDMANDGHDPLAQSPSVEFLDIDAMASVGHGTGVAAVIAAGGLKPTADMPMYSERWWNESPMIGVAPEATIVPIRAVHGPVHLFDDDVAEAVRIAIAGGCHVISLSLGGFGFRGLEDAIRDAVDAGCIVVAAAGNEFGVVVDPAAYPETVAVASVDRDGRPYLAGSSRGPAVHVSAPGVDVVRPDFEIGDNGPVNVLTPGTGTTYATAHVAGVAALWLRRHGFDELTSHYPGEQLSQLFMHLLLESVTTWEDLGFGAEFGMDWGAGIIDADKILNADVLEAGGVPIAEDELARAFRRTTLGGTDRVAGGIASVLTAEGTLKTRFSFVTALGGLVGGVLDRGADLVATVVGRARSWMLTKLGRSVDAPAVEDGLERTTRLLRREMVAHRRLDREFNDALEAGNPDAVPVPRHASSYLRMILTNANSAPVGELGADFSAGLRRALRGEARVTRNYRWIGVSALLGAVALAVWWSRTDPSVQASVVAEVSGVAGLFGLMGVGLYGAAQAIERFLEYTIGRWAFRDVPGRAADRALVLLGSGILVGTLAAMVFEVGFLAQVSMANEDYLTDPWFVATDVVVTGLAVGGGAKPVHDLVERIRAGLPTVGADTQPQ